MHYAVIISNGGKCHGETRPFSYPVRCHGLSAERNEGVVPEHDCGAHKAVILCGGASGCANHGGTADRKSRGGADRAAEILKTPKTRNASF